MAGSVDSDTEAVVLLYSSPHSSCVVKYSGGCGVGSVTLEEVDLVLQKPYCITSTDRYGVQLLTRYYLFNKNRTTLTAVAVKKVTWIHYVCQ